MQKFSPQEINEKYKAAPQPIKEVFMAQETTEAVESIGDKYQLHVDQKGVFGREVGLVLIGLRSPKEFALVLENEVGVPIETVRNIIKDVNEKIFSSLRTKLESGEDLNLSPSTDKQPPIVPLKEPTQEKVAVNVFADEPAEEKTTTQPEVEAPVVSDVPSKEEILLPADKPIARPSAPVEENTPIVENKKEEVTQTPQKKYAIDPYREPIE